MLPINIGARYRQEYPDPAAITSSKKPSHQTRTTTALSVDAQSPAQSPTLSPLPSPARLPTPLLPPAQSLTEHDDQNSNSPSGSPTTSPDDYNCHPTLPKPSWSLQWAFHSFWPFAV
ncbi:hypothetical protein BYT27DRAFT_7262262 [Phlegmacium glaucopus]|nr:hypothetical protein BYT27DRAFT_7262262 [Phlegmacium glaucopus]